MEKGIVLLLTGTINTNNKHFTKLNDKEQRLVQYVDTIRHYLSAYNFPIIFVENSNEDLSGYFKSEIEEKKIEVLTFDGNSYAASTGKGYGDMECIKYALLHSKFIHEDSFIFKITGRYIIRNLAKYINFYRRNSKLDLMVDITNNFQFSVSSFFGFRPFFVTKYLSKNQHLINDSKGWYFEHVLSKSVLEAIGDRINFSILKYYPKISAISGTTGKKYKDSFFYFIPRSLKYFIRYYIVIR